MIDKMHPCPCLFLPSHPPPPPPLNLFCSIFQTPCLLRPHVYSGPKSKETFWVWLWFCFKPTIVLKVALNKDLFLEIFRSTTCWYLMNWFLNQFCHIIFSKSIFYSSDNFWKLLRPHKWESKFRSSRNLDRAQFDV